MSEYVDKFISHIEAAGCAPASAADIIDTDGKQKLIKGHDDRNGSKSLYFSYIEDQYGAFGTYKSCKSGLNGWWNNKASKELSDAEKDEFNRKRDERREAEKKLRKADADACAAQAKELWEMAKPAKAHPYLTKKQVKGTGCRVHDGMLLIPLRNTDGELRTFQTITKDTKDRWYSFFLPDGTLAKGGDKSGCYHGVVHPKKNKDVICVAEGYATARSIAEATGIAVVAAMDAGSLKPVAKAIKKKHPEATIIIGADNDQWTFKTPRPAKVKDIKKGEVPGDDERWTEWRDAGFLHNIGVEKAQQAAAAVGGYAVIPDIQGNDPDKRSDFNDIHTSDGAEAVTKQFDEMAAIIEENKLRAPVDDGPPSHHDEVPEHDEGVAAMARNIDPDDDDVGDMGFPLRILGEQGDKYCYYPFNKQKIVKLSPKEHTFPTLYTLADVDQWEAVLGSKMSKSQMADVIANMLIKESHRKPAFEEHGRVRGSGAWLDAGRFLLHCGDEVIEDGKRVKPKDILGKYTYVKSGIVFDPHDDALPDEEAVKLKDICAMFNWERSLSGTLMAGWIVIAPVCAALDWRPHVWLTGESGSGKSTIIKKIVRTILGDCAINLDGGTTEAAIRSKIGNSARPVVIDEAGGKPGGSNFDTDMDKIIALARGASDGSNILKMGQEQVAIRACFCFGGVTPPITSLQDETRNTLMALKKNKGADAYEDFAAIVNKIDNTITPEYSRKLLRRTVDNIDTLLANVKTFKKVATEHLRDARSADQIAPMLAGYCLLMSTDVITEEKAKAIVEKRSWIEHTTITVKSDPERLLQYINTITVPVRSLGIDMTIGDCILNAIDSDNGPLGVDTARRMLANYSIKLAKNNEGVLFGASNQSMEQKLRNTEWARGYKKMLERLDFAEPVGSTSFSAGNKQRAVKLPMSYFLDDDKAHQPSLPIDEPEKVEVKEDEFEIPFD